MKKFRAVVKREYVQRVRSRMFLIVTIGAPLMFALFTVVPILISSIRAGGPTRIAVADETGRMYERVRESLTGGRDDEDEADAAEVAARAGKGSNDRIRQAANAREQGVAGEQVALGGRIHNSAEGHSCERRGLLLRAQRRRCVHARAGQKPPDDSRARRAA